MTKRQRSTRRRQRAKAKVLCAIDFETRCRSEWGHFHMWDTHVVDYKRGVSDRNEQLMVYARGWPEWVRS